MLDFDPSETAQILETHRLSALYRYSLEAQTDEILKRMVALTAQIFGVPSAMISLVEETHQWSKVCYGPDHYGLATLAEAPREDAFCSHVISDDRVMVVYDAAQDERFADKPLVIGEAGVRFYAGAPLISPDGYRLGALAIVDSAPREQFSALQSETLQTLAALVMDLLEARLKQHPPRPVPTQGGLYDEATGLPTPQLMRDRLQQTLLQAERTGKVVAVFAIRIDKAKDISETLGASAGDHFVRKVAERIHSALRSGDTLARSAEDEFTAILALNYGEESALIVERILEIAATPIALSERAFSFDVHVGVSLSSTDGKEAGAQLGAASSALSKVAPPRRYRYHQDVMTQVFEEQIDLGRDLRRAVTWGEFVFHFQPRVEALSTTSVGAEALIRWQHPKRGLLLPKRFLGIAERTEVMAQLDSWTLRTTCQQLSDWQRDDFPLRLSCNLAASSFETEGFTSSIIHQLNELGKAAESLEIELTESMLIKDIGRAAGELMRLKLAAPGLKVAIDDFGTGHSSLAYLRHLPVDVLKIDRRFVKDLDHRDARTRATTLAVIRSVIRLAHDLGLSVVAEGVETVTQLDILVALGCDEMQGYYFSEPLPLELLRQTTSPEGKLALKRGGI